MKRTFLVLLVGGLLACKKTAGPADSAPAIGQPFELGLQKAATLSGSGGPISLTLTEVHEARCPSGMQCIWAGYAAVAVQLSDATGIPQTARISLLNKYLPTYTLDSVSVELNQKTYWLRLLEVTPYPGTNGGQLTTAKLRLRPA
ncbi:hypothetical protein [Hymenobacter bucti]|uniref:Lipoprotein n=1 Tax=Hymenobacter bucti TaxID=1844114 RepID=A0ABW4QP22_9BACT